MVQTGVLVPPVCGLLIVGAVMLSVTWMFS
jgi:hypothetical protein